MKIKRMFSTLLPNQVISKYKELAWNSGKNYELIINEFKKDKEINFVNKKIPDFLYNTILNEYLNFDLIDESINLLIHVI